MFSFTSDMTLIYFAVAAFVIIIAARFVLRPVEANMGTGRTVAQPKGPASMDEVRRLIRGGNKIAAIKAYRELHHCGLKEAKDAVDALAP